MTVALWCPKTPTHHIFVSEQTLCLGDDGVMTREDDTATFGNHHCLSTVTAT